MVDIINKLSEYDCGILYGDGFYSEKEALYIFSTTTSDLSEKMKFKFEKWGVDFNYKIETHPTEEKENWEDLHIYRLKNIDSINLNNYLVNCFKNLSIGFVLGYIETKGSLFNYFETSKNKAGKERWRLSLSGEKEDLEIIVAYLTNLDGDIVFSNIYRRKDKKRELEDIISESYRVHINRRYSIYKLITLFENNDLVNEINLYFKDKINKFKIYHENNPFNRKKSVFKTYRLAGNYLARELGLEVKGERGGVGGGSGSKPIYLWENGEKLKEIGKGWKEAYFYLKAIYEEENEFKAPEVIENLSD